MNIGFIGLGKLGLPCALAAENQGHTIYGYDINPEIENILKSKKLPYREEGAQDLLNNNKINWSSISEVVEKSDIIFVPIQTPHSEKYEGITRIPEERVDFNYDWLISGMTNLSEEINRQGKDKIVIIISTVLPGTIRREIKPILNNHVKLCYNPFFIAMGTTIKDFMSPEFVLFGVDDNSAYEVAKDFYKTIHNKQIYKCTIEEAELIKVTYNTFITMKICLANTVMEISHKLDNINCDNVMGGLFLANERLISTKYLTGGMGDGGGCHPRDNIALSWLAKNVDLSFDWYQNLMQCRENQTEWLSKLILEEQRNSELEIVILGKTFKKETNLVVGSTAILLKNILEESIPSVKIYDPWIDSGDAPISTRSIFFIATNHDIFLEYKFPIGSIVIDPWRYIKEQDGVRLIKVGNSKHE
jgi:UDPglucose 6-dehydrogenase